MNKCGTGKLLIVVAGALSLAACGLQLEKAERMNAQGSSFNVNLYGGYVELSRSEFNEGDYRDSDRFALAALDAGAGAGNPPQPAKIASRQLPENKVGELTEARAKLMAVLDNPVSRTEMPEDTATAQIMFDCWMQEQEENFQADDIARCRSGFSEKIATLEDALRPKVVAVQPKVAKTPPPKVAKALPPKPIEFVVYFDFDKAKLNPSAIAVLSDAKVAVKKMGGTVSVSGFTDTAGKASYNKMLSELRADAVAKAISAVGVSADAISTKAFGQTNLAVPTPDGVRKAANRRVLIIVEPK